MRFAAKTVILTLALTAGVAFAKEGVQDPTVKSRMDLMAIVGENTKILGDMAADKAPYNDGAAVAAKNALIAASARIQAEFEVEADDPVSEARPDIWMNMEGFLKHAELLETAAQAIDVTTLASLQTGMGAIGGACKACHTDFRAKK
jgi:cytochrome c556